MDPFGRPLVRVKLHNTYGTFWTCLAYRLYEKESRAYIESLQHRVMLYFVSIIFGRSFDTLEAFFSNTRACVVQSNNPQCIEHPAIQSWLKTSNDRKRISDARTKARAIAYVRTNSTLGMCSCRYTNLYLFASLFSFDVYLDNCDGRRHVVIESYRQPKRAVDIEDPPVCGEEEFFVSIHFEHGEFQLFLPKRSNRRRCVERPWMMLESSTKHADQRSALYRLVRCTPDKVFPVGFLVLSERHVHYCIVDACHPTGFYRVLPANNRVLRFRKSLFAFVSNGLERDDRYQCVGHVDDQGSPLAFFMDPRKTRLVMVVQSDREAFARQCLVEEMGFAYPK